MTGITSRRLLLLGALLAGLAACSERPVPTLREEVVAALRATGDARGAEIADQAATVVSLLATPYFAKWRLVDVQATDVARWSHPPRFRVGLGAGDAAAVLLSGAPERWNEMVRADHDRLTTVDMVAKAAAAYVDVIHDFRGLQTVLLNGLADAPFPTSATTARSAALARWGAAVAAPVAVRNGVGFDAVVWTTLQDALRRHAITIAADGTFAQSIEVIARGLPLSLGR